jgi:TolA-binding protein
MRAALASGLLMLALTAGCAAKAAPPAPVSSPASDALRIARIVRLMELNRQLVSLQVEQIGLSQRYGQNHPEMQRLRLQIETLDEELKRGFLPEEQAAVAGYDDRATALRLQLAEYRGKGRGENHPDVVTARAQLAALEEMTRERRTPEVEEAALRARVSEQPDSAGPQIELALFYLRGGRAADAATALERALALLQRRRPRR